MTGATLTQSGQQWHEQFSAADLERLFAACFGERYQTTLCGGHDEPFYQPPDGREPARLCYRADYFRSALHEVAHWCVAGVERRRLPDFGYWYEPDGRSAAQQQAFQAAEVRPQAFELVFCAAAGHRFSVSLDNLGMNAGTDVAAFESRVFEVAQNLLDAPPKRMAQWARCLSGHYRGVAMMPSPALLEEVFHALGGTGQQA